MKSVQDFKKMSNECVLPGTLRSEDVSISGRHDPEQPLILQKPVVTSGEFIFLIIDCYLHLLDFVRFFCLYYKQGSAPEIFQLSATFRPRKRQEVLLLAFSFGVSYCTRQIMATKLKPLFLFLENLFVS